jgi:hypothetical protein
VAALPSGCALSSPNRFTAHIVSASSIS